jgi:hypothetical protein
MPWMESSVTKERVRFVARVPDGEAMTIRHDNACRDIGVSRKTGCKIFDREGTRAGRAERSVATPGVSYVVLPCVRAGQLICWRSRRDSNPR